MEVGPEAGFQKVRAWGPGLKTGMVGKSADFVVETIGTDVGTLGEPRAAVEETGLCSEFLTSSPNLFIRVRRFLHRRAVAGQN